MFYKYKKGIILIILLFLCFFLLPQISQAATYYLDAVNGNDNNPGTSELPWKTLTKTKAVAIGGDTIYLRSGNYGAFLDTTNRTNWLTYKADTGHTPVFTYIALGNVNGPYNNYLHFEGITIGPGNPSGDYRAVFIHLSNYVRLRGCTIIGNNSVENVFQYWLPTNAGVYINAGTNIEINGCTISDFRFGVWTKPTTVETDTIQVINSDISHAQHGITFWGNNWTISNNNLHDLYSDGIILSGRNSTINNNTIHHIDRPVVYTDTTGASYNNATKTITANSGTPYSGWSSGYVQFLILTVNGTRVSGAAYEVSSFNGSSIILKSAIGQNYPTITKIETTANYHLDGIQTYPGSGSYSPSNVNVLANNIHDIGAYTWSDAQGIWSGSSKDGSISYNNMVYENNLVYNIYGSGRGVAFFGNHRNLIVRNNTVDGRLEFIYKAQCDDFSGNMIEKVDFQQRYEGVDYNPKTPNPTYENYNVVNRWWVHIDDAIFTPGANSVEIGNDIAWKAQFVNYDAKDFRLDPNSAAVNIGVLNAPLTDILGNPRDSQPDAGAYEYVSATPPPILYGDVNGDGAVSSADALLVAQHSLGLTTLTSSQIQKGDVSGDGKVSAYDAALILQKIAGIISKFPKE